MNLIGRKFKNSRLDVEIYVYEVEGTEWFIGKNIALSLGYKDPSGTVKYVNDAYKKKVYVKTIENIDEWIKNTSKIIINNNRTLIPREGVLQLIAKSDKISQKQKQEWYSMFDVEKVLISRKEIEFGNMLIEALNEIDIETITQYNIENKYRIDFYLPSKNIAVEYDEGQHQYHVKEDIERENHIKEKLGCKFIRCDYRDSDIKNVMKILKEIMI